MTSPRDRTERSKAAGHNTNRLWTTGQITQGTISIGAEILGSTVVWHTTQRSTGHWKVGARDIGSSRDEAGSHAGSGHIVGSRRTARHFPVARLALDWLAVGWFTLGLLAIVQKPGMILAAAR